MIIETDESGKEVDAQNVHDEVIVIAENQNNEASSSPSGNKADVVDKNETSNVKVDEVDSNQRDETSDVTGNVITEGKNEEVPQECDSTADVKQMAKSPAQPQQQSQSLLMKLGLLGPESAAGRCGAAGRGTTRRNATCGATSGAVASRRQPLESNATRAGTSPV